MNFPDGIKQILPKYLSARSTVELLKELDDYPENIDARMYLSSDLGPELNDIILQSDCLSEMLIFDWETQRSQMGKCLIISNSCDIDENNKRSYFNPKIVYCPLIDAEKYRKACLRKMKEDAVNQHFNMLRQQKITQAMFFPAGSNLTHDAIVFFDHVLSVKNESVSRENLADKRLFRLSNYGFYLFLFKLSIHHLRMQDGIDRLPESSLTN